MTDLEKVGGLIKSPGMLMFIELLRWGDKGLVRGTGLPLPTDGKRLRDVYHNYTNPILQQKQNCGKLQMQSSEFINDYYVGLPTMDRPI